MTTTEKALEIANKMYNGSVFDKTKQQHLDELENAKRCALIVVDELLKECVLYKPSPNSRFDYLEEVRKEINKL